MWHLCQGAADTMDDAGDTLMLLMWCLSSGLKFESPIDYPGAAVSHRLIGTPIMICRRLAWTAAVSPGGAPRCPVAAQSDLAFPSKPLG